MQAIRKAANDFVEGFNEGRAEPIQTGPVIARFSVFGHRRTVRLIDPYLIPGRLLLAAICLGATYSSTHLVLDHLGW